MGGRIQVVRTLVLLLVVLLCDWPQCNADILKLPTDARSEWMSIPGSKDGERAPKLFYQYVYGNDSSWGRETSHVILDVKVKQADAKLIAWIEYGSEESDASCLSKSTTGSISVHDGSGDWKWSPDVGKSGLVKILIENCRKSSVDVQGTITWQSKYGYLPGDEYPMMPFYDTMVLMYLFVLGFWAYLTVRYAKDLLLLQYITFGMIGIGLVEMVVSAFSYWLWNYVGQNFPITHVVYQGMYIFNASMCRAFVLALSMGYAVVKPSLGTVKYRVLALALAYFIFGSMQAVGEFLVADDVFFWKFILEIPLSVVNTIFFLWTFSSLHRTIMKLKVRKQSAKLGIYQKWAAILGVAMVIAVFFMMFEMLLRFFAVGSDWKIRWLFEAFWRFLYLLVLISIAAVWRPSSENVRFAYSADINIDDEEQEMQSMPAPMVEDSTARLRNIAKAEAEGHDDTPETAEAAASIAPAPKKLMASFTIEMSDDEEEQEEESKIE